LPPSPDGIFRLVTIGSNGNVTDGYHDLDVPLGAPPVSIKMTGQVTPLGIGYSIVLEHFDYGSTTTKRRYEGLLVFDSPIETRLVITGFKTTIHLPLKRTAKSTKVKTMALALVQDDGTVVITRP
jgi:hypothetical protein